MKEKKSLWRWLSQMGPGFLVTAAFIGPGTVTTASVAGASFGYTLLSAVVLSAFATIVLQEMSARLGLVTGQGLGEALRTSFSPPLLRWMVLLLVVAAIACGNAAYQTGNVTGAALGLEEVTGWSRQVWCPLIGAAALLLLVMGVYQTVERTLMVLVVTMSCCFLITAVMVRPHLGDLARGLIPMRFPSGAGMTVIALIGTTIVPYNLFLHASVVSEKWPAGRDVDQSLHQCRRDTILAIALGGGVTMAILVSSAAMFHAAGVKVDSAGMMARQLEPLLGSSAKYFFAGGLFAAGMTSAVTAPLAAAYATCGALGWPKQLRSLRFAAVWLFVIATGTILATVGKSPIQAILFAQAANGILLPVIVVFLLTVMNRKQLLGRYTNGRWANVVGVFVVLTAAGLGIAQLIRLLK